MLLWPVRGPQSGVGSLVFLLQFERGKHITTSAQCSCFNVEDSTIHCGSSCASYGLYYALNAQRKPPPLGQGRAGSGETICDLEDKYYIEKITLKCAFKCSNHGILNFTKSTFQCHVWPVSFIKLKMVQLSLP